jgi:hypothetical protein
VRINPYELHINDPEYYDELYSGPSKRRDKWEWSAKMFGNPKSMFGTVPHDHHRLRRSVLNPYFSKRSVTRLEPVIQSLIDSLCARFREFRQSGKPLDLHAAYAALTMDIISEYSFARPYGLLENPELGQEWVNIVISVSEQSLLIKQFGWILPMMKATPEWLVAMTSLGMARLLKFQQVRPHSYIMQQPFPFTTTFVAPLSVCLFP